MQKVSRNGQVTIPKEIREKVNLQDGDWISPEITQEGILFRVVEQFTPQFRQLQQA